MNLHFLLAQTPVESTKDQDGAAQRLAIDNELRAHAGTRSVVVRLERLDLSKFDRKGNGFLLSKRNPIPPKTRSVVNNGMVQICEQCFDSFDAYFEVEKERYIAPYNDLLQKEKDANLVASEQLEKIDNRWNEENQKWANMSHRIDRLQDKYAALVRKNVELRAKVGPISKSVSHDHSYAHF